MPRFPAFHDPGFHIVARGKHSKRALVHYPGELRHCVAHEKQALLPITSQKITRPQSSEQIAEHL